MNVQLPDNSVVQFPDGMPQDQVNAAITSYLAPSSPQIQQATPSTGLDRFLQGVQDPMNGMGQLMLHGAQYLPDSALNAVPGLRGSDAYMDKNLSQQEDQYKAARQAAGSNGFDWYRMGGNMAAMAPVAAVAPVAEGYAGAAGYGALTGAGYGLTQPVTNANNGDYATQKALQAGTGALTGGIVSPAMMGVSRIISPHISEDVQSLMDQGITPTPGQILGGGFKATEEKASSIPLLGDIIKTGQKRALDQFNTAALGRALDPIGEDAPDQIGREGLQYVSDKLGSAYDNLLPKLSMQLDEPFAEEIAQARETVPPKLQNDFDTIIGDQFQKFDQNSILKGEALKGFQSELSTQARGYGSDSSFDSRKLGAALDDVHSAFGDALARSNPANAEELSNINRGYANYTILRRAGAMNKEDAPFTPAQLAAAVKGGDQSVGKGNFARGSALMQDLSDPGQAVLGSKYPDSGTAGRALVAMGGAALAGHGLPLPLIAGGALASTPYLNGTAQKLAAGLLTARPPGAQFLGNAVQELSPYLTAAVASSNAR